MRQESEFLSTQPENGVHEHANIKLFLKSKLIQLLWRTIWKFIKKLGVKLPNIPAYALRKS